MIVVLDSWAVLRYLEGDGPAADVVDDLVSHRRPVMSWINLGEVHYILRREVGEDAAASTVHDLESVVDARLPDRTLVQTAARIKADHAMAHADAFAAALAVSLRGELWTGDPELLIDDAAWAHRDLRSEQGREPG